MKNVFKGLFIITLTMLVLGCGPSVKVTDSWKTPDIEETKRESTELCVF